MRLSKKVVADVIAVVVDVELENLFYPIVACSP